MIPPLTPPLKPRGEDQIEHAVILSDHRQPVNQTEYAVILGDHRQPENQTEHAVILGDHGQSVDQIEHAVIFSSPTNSQQKHITTSSSALVPASSIWPLLL